MKRRFIIYRRDGSSSKMNGKYQLSRSDPFAVPNRLITRFCSIALICIVGCVGRDKRVSLGTTQLPDLNARSRPIEEFDVTGMKLVGEISENDIREIIKAVATLPI